VEPISIREIGADPIGQSIVINEALVNYAPIEQMSREQVIVSGPADIAAYGERIRGRLVLIGDTQLGSSDDLFIVPGDPKNRRGVFMHAALANTLLAEHIYEFRSNVRLALDVFLSGIILATIALARKFARASVDRHSLESRVIVWAVLLVVAGGFGFIVYFRILWLDFLLVGLFLLVHPAAEHRLRRALESLRAQIGSRGRH